MLQEARREKQDVSLDLLLNRSCLLTSRVSLLVSCFCRLFCCILTLLHSSQSNLRTIDELYC